MRDAASIPRVLLLHPKIRDEARNIIEQAELGLPENIAIRVVQGLRTMKEQDALYAQGRTKPGKIVTMAKGWQSWHVWSLALDFAILIDTDKSGTYDLVSWDIRKDNDTDGIADWLEVVNVFESYGWSWGGRWHSIIDYPHVQRTFGYTLQDMYLKYQKKDFILGSTYLNL